MRSKQYPNSLVALIVFIAIVNLMAEVYYWYWRMRWFDRPMHFLGGVWLAGTALWWFYGRRSVPLSGFFKIFMVCIAAAFGVGLVWEIFQAGLGLETAGHASRIGGTLSDLLFDTIGGTTVAIYAWFRTRNNK